MCHLFNCEKIDRCFYHVVVIWHLLSADRLLKRQTLRKKYTKEVKSSIRPGDPKLVLINGKSRRVRPHEDLALYIYKI